MLGFDGDTIGLYIAIGAMALLAVDGVRHGAPLFDLGEFTKSDHYTNFFFQSDTGFALNWYYYSPIQIMWLVSQFLYCAPRTSVLAVNDMLAFGLLAGFRDAGLVVPRDVSVIGMDGLYLSSLTSPGLTTVSLPVPEMARTMVERLIARLADPTVAPGEFLFKPSLVQRESVARPPEKKAKA